MFSIRKKDGLARIGALQTEHGIISTPVLLPVINPNSQMLQPDEMVVCGAEAFITNAYLLYRNLSNREKVLQKGLHEYINFKGPLMTDSGAFQLMEYGEVSITNQEVIKFQEQIGSDIGVFLDVPTKDGNYEDFDQALNETLNRSDEHLKFHDIESKVIWAGPIQGGKYLDLVKKSCVEMGKKDFEIHSIGSVVPFLERYQFETVLNMILIAKQTLPINRPIHLFGAGHPMFFALAVYLGIDIFDSAAYMLYAKKNRYITPFGTDYLENLQYLPCSCEICSSYTVSELKELDHIPRIKLIAKHNLIVSLEEIRRIKQAIIAGRLYELVLARTMSHPSLAKTLKLLFGKSTSQFIEQYETINKSRSFLFTHPILISHPLLIRYRQRIFQRFYNWSKKLIIIQDYQKQRSSSSYQILRLSPIFGIIPDELRGIFPLVQYERIPLQYSTDIKSFITEFLKKYRTQFDQIEIHPSISLDFEFIKEFNIFEQKKQEEKIDDLHIVKSILDFQFGSNIHRILDDKTIKVSRSQKTGIIRHFSDDSDLLGTFRPSDFTIIPTQKFAHELHKNLPRNKNRVIADQESIPFVVKNKDLLAKFVLKADPEIRCGEEVIIVDTEDTFLGFGKTMLSPQEMLAFKRGVAVQIRK